MPRKWKRKDVSAATSYILQHYSICLSQCSKGKQSDTPLHTGVKHTAVFNAISFVVSFHSILNCYEWRSCVTSLHQWKAGWPWGSRLLQNLSRTFSFLPRQSKWLDPLVTGEIKSNFTGPQSRLILLIGCWKAVMGWDCSPIAPRKTLISSLTVCSSTEE